MLTPEEEVLLRSNISAARRIPARVEVVNHQAQQPYPEFPKIEIPDASPAIASIAAALSKMAGAQTVMAQAQQDNMRSVAKSVNEAVGALAKVVSEIREFDGSKIEKAIAANTAALKDLARVIGEPKTLITDHRGQLIGVRLGDPEEADEPSYS